MSEPGTKGSFKRIARRSWPLRIGDAPDVEVVLIDTAGRPPSGVGEPPLMPAAAAIANAIFDAVGARVRDLPITSERVLAALPSDTYRRTEASGEHQGVGRFRLIGPGRGEWCEPGVDARQLVWREARARKEPGR